MNLANKNILVAPLNWGLGHATRCIPIIKALEANGFTPIIASDGIALEMLRKEFPHLPTLELPSYQIESDKSRANLKWEMLKNMPKMIRAILDENKLVEKWAKEYTLTGIVSDNRLGVFNKRVQSVFITHQLKVMTGSTTWITSKLYQRAIRKFDECWVPDFEKGPNLTGTLGHAVNHGLKLKYIGPLGRLEKKELPIKYDLMVLLSGAEPQREILENILSQKLLNFDGEIVFIKGKLENSQTRERVNNILHYNFMTSNELERTFNESKVVLCRSGYTTVMDLTKLGKKAFFIPTPGQYEQEYLAKKLKRQGLVPYARQDDFTLEHLKELDLYKGLNMVDNPIPWKNLFYLFGSETRAVKKPF
ncbi:glycosyltransferase [Flavobacterium psychrotolerans]|uniref:Glycosyltransferase n=1 Tax=Flavobacterium psychrotolerans TaxID=2169410 RepID=A0A2U1JJJ4_9FLAO|nr:glycosyltransferase [Flavobacterium psychrotolerans]PWA05185.1 glycosyltransferase [Flavobacterium psychrotolerans]